MKLRSALGLEIQDLKKIGKERKVVIKSIISEIVHSKEKPLRLNIERLTDRK